MDEPEPVDNAFDGLVSAPQGERAFDGAPPTVPHPVGMRPVCAGCHGEEGWPGLQTTHPERVAHRVAMLAATSPWRQQELVLVGFERSVGLCHDLFATTVERLRAPLPDLPALLLREFDDDGQGG